MIVESYPVRVGEREKVKLVVIATPTELANLRALLDLAEIPAPAPAANPWREIDDEPDPPHAGPSVMA